MFVLGYVFSINLFLCFTIAYDWKEYLSQHDSLELNPHSENWSDKSDIPKVSPAEHAPRHAPDKLNYDNNSTSLGNPQIEKYFGVESSRYNNNKCLTLRMVYKHIKKILINVKNSVTDIDQVIQLINRYLNTHENDDEAELPISLTNPMISKSILNNINNNRIPSATVCQESLRKLFSQTTLLQNEILRHPICNLSLRTIIPQSVPDMPAHFINNNYTGQISAIMLPIIRILNDADVYQDPSVPEYIINILEQNKKILQPKLFRLLLTLLRINRKIPINKWKEIIILLLDAINNYQYFSDRFLEQISHILDDSGIIHSKFGNLIQLIIQNYQYQHIYESHIDFILRILEPIRQGTIHPRILDIIIYILNPNNTQSLGPEYIQVLLEFLVPIHGSINPKLINVVQLLLKHGNKHHLHVSNLKKIKSILRLNNKGNTNPLTYKMIYNLIPNKQRFNNDQVNIILNLLSLVKSENVGPKMIDILLYILNLKPSQINPEYTQILLQLFNPKSALIESVVIDIVHLLYELNLKEVLNEKQIDILFSQLKTDQDGYVDLRILKLIYKLLSQSKAYDNTQIDVVLKILNLINNGGADPKVHKIIMYILDLKNVDLKVLRQVQVILKLLNPVDGFIKPELINIANLLIQLREANILNPQLIDEVFSLVKPDNRGNLNLEIIKLINYLVTSGNNINPMDIDLMIHQIKHLNSGYGIIPGEYPQYLDIRVVNIAQRLLDPGFKIYNRDQINDLLLLLNFPGAVHPKIIDIIENILIIHKNLSSTDINILINLLQLTNNGSKFSQLLNIIDFVLNQYNNYYQPPNPEYIQLILRLLAPNQGLIDPKQISIVELILHRNNENVLDIRHLKRIALLLRPRSQEYIDALIYDLIYTWLSNNQDYSYRQINIIFNILEFVKYKTDDPRLVDILYRILDPKPSQINPLHNTILIRLLEPKNGTINPLLLDVVQLLFKVYSNELLNERQIANILYILEPNKDEIADLRIVELIINLLSSTIVTDTNQLEVILNMLSLNKNRATDPRILDILLYILNPRHETLDLKQIDVILHLLKPKEGYICPVFVDIAQLVIKLREVGFLNPNQMDFIFLLVKSNITRDISIQIVDIITNLLTYGNILNPEQLDFIMYLLQQISYGSVDARTLDIIFYFIKTNSNQRITEYFEILKYFMDHNDGYLDLGVLNVIQQLIQSNNIALNQEQIKTIFFLLKPDSSQAVNPRIIKIIDFLITNGKEYNVLQINTVLEVIKLTNNGKQLPEVLDNLTLILNPNNSQSLSPEYLQLTLQLLQHNRGKINPKLVDIINLLLKRNNKLYFDVKQFEILTLLLKPVNQENIDDLIYDIIYFWLSNDQNYNYEQVEIILDLLKLIKYNKSNPKVVDILFLIFDRKSSQINPDYTPVVLQLLKPQNESINPLIVDIIHILYKVNFTNVLDTNKVDLIFSILEPSNGGIIDQRIVENLFELLSFSKFTDKAQINIILSILKQIGNGTAHPRIFEIPHTIFNLKNTHPTYLKHNQFILQLLNPADGFINPIFVHIAELLLRLRKVDFLNPEQINMIFSLVKPDNRGNINLTIIEIVDNLISSQKNMSPKDVNYIINIMEQIRNGSAGPVIPNIILYYLKGNRSEGIHIENLEFIKQFLIPVEGKYVDTRFVSIIDHLLHLDIQSLNREQLKIIISLLIQEGDSRVLEIINYLIISSKNYNYTHTDIVLKLLQLTKNIYLYPDVLDIILFILKPNNGLVVSPECIQTILDLLKLRGNGYLDPILVEISQLLIRNLKVINQTQIGMIFLLLKPDIQGNVDPNIVKVIFMLLKTYTFVDSLQVDIILEILTKIKNINVDPRIISIILYTLDPEHSKNIAPEHKLTILDLLNPRNNKYTDVRFIDIAQLLIEIYDTNIFNNNKIKVLFSLIKSSGYEKRIMEITYNLLSKSRHLTTAGINILLSLLVPNAHGIIESTSVDIVHMILNSFNLNPHLADTLLSLVHSNLPGLKYSKAFITLLLLNKDKQLNHNNLEKLVNIIINESAGSVGANADLIKNPYVVPPITFIPPDYKPPTNHVSVIPNDFMPFNYNLKYLNANILNAFTILNNQNLLVKPQGIQGEPLELLFKLIETGDPNLIIELSYLVQNEEPFKYTHNYYVKYRFPLTNFVRGMRALLNRWPNLVLSPKKLLKEIISISNATKISPTLKGYPKGDLKTIAFGYRNPLLRKKLDNEDLQLNDQIAKVHELQMDITPDDLFKLNQLNEDTYPKFTARNGTSLIDKLFVLAKSAQAAGKNTYV